MKKPDTIIIDDLKWRYLVRSVNRGKNVMMVGPTGCGKTTAVHEVAKSYPDHPFFHFNMGATQDARLTLIGNTHYNKEVGTFVTEALFAKAIQTPHAIILLDELTRAHPDAWNILMSVLDEKQRYLRIDEHPETPTIRVAPGVSFIATANIGAEYTSTRALDMALMDRFPVVIEMPALGKEDELALFRQLYPDSPHQQLIEAICEIAEVARNSAQSENPILSNGISTRMTVEMVDLLHDGFTLQEIAEVSIYPFFSAMGGVESERTFMMQLTQKFLT